MLKKILKRIPGAITLGQKLGVVKKPEDKRMFLLKSMPPHSVGAEIGVHLGDFSRKILDIIMPRELHLIDPWKYEQSATYSRALYGGLATDGQKEMDDRYQHVCTRFENEVRDGIVKIHRAFSDVILKPFPNGYFDWIYIDGNHLYEYVKNDLDIAFQKTRAGGYITGDDYTDGGWWEGGVKRAVDEFINDHEVDLIEIRSGQFILQKKDLAPQAEN